MRTFKTLFLLTLFLLIFGSAGYFGYLLFIKPNRIERLEKAAKAAAPTATPDQAKPAFDSLKSRQAAGVTPAIRDEWAAWVAANTNSPLLPEGRRFLGAANMILLFQPSGTADSTLPVYTVVKGDSLARIAAKQHSSAELIQRANQLPGIGLQIGQQLVIPQLKISLEIDRNAKTLSLLNNGAYLKEYPLLSCPAAPQKSAAVTTRVLDKNAIAGTKRVAFGDKAYAAAEKSILLAQAPAIVAAPATSVAATDGTNAPTAPPAAPIPPMPGGFVLQEADLQEIFPLVSRNASVIIH